MQATSITSNPLDHSSHYEITFGDNYLKVVANAQSHPLAMQAVQTIKAELGERYRLHGKQEANAEHTVQGGEPPQSSSSEPTSPTEPESPSPSPPLREKLRFYADAHIRNMETGKVVRTSLTEARWTLGVFEDLIGNKPLDCITYDDVVKFQNAIKEWPANIQNRKDFKKLRPREVIKEGRLQGLPPITRETQGNHVRALCTFFNWCVETKHLKESPACLVDWTRYSDPIKPTKEVIEKHDLCSLFEPACTGTITDPRFFWAMCISYKSSMRVREIAQLRVEDIKYATGCDELGNPIDTYYFDISKHGKGKSVKSNWSTRQVPIHSEIITLGFLQYVDDVKKAGFSELFPRIEKKGKDPGHPITIWFAKYKKARGITSRRKTLHCFRHTFTTLAKYSQVPTSVIDAINGHAPEHNVREKYYAKRPNVLACKKYMEKIVFPVVPMQPYVSGQFDAYLKEVQKDREHQVAHELSLERREKERVKKVKATGVSGQPTATTMAAMKKAGRSPKHIPAPSVIHHEPASPFDDD
ncbi:site-specific integrase [Dyella agri]|uniref:Site-specific integrase n=1 Tax=Dyella agri TaxID=1926869 RepID=A0ABW8KLD9_9GAMM